MRFGMFDVIRWHETVSGEDTISNALEQVEFADKLGIQDIWLGEHHFSRHGILSGIFSFMGAVAARTTQARIGTSIVILPFHNPVQVAEEAAIIDIVSNGRFNLGVGAGYQAQEFHGMGVEITKSRELFKEYLDVVKKCWEDGKLTYKGEYIDIEDIWVIPKPIQKPGLPSTSRSAPARRASITRHRSGCPSWSAARRRRLDRRLASWRCGTSAWSTTATRMSTSIYR